MRGIKTCGRVSDGGRRCVLVNGGLDSLALAAQTFTLLPAHLHQHPEAQILHRQLELLVLGVVGVTTFLRGRRAERAGLLQPSHTRPLTALRPQPRPRPPPLTSTLESEEKLTFSALKVSMNFSSSSGGRKSPIKCFPLPISVRDSAHSGEQRTRLSTYNGWHPAEQAAPEPCPASPRVFSISILRRRCSQVPACWSTSSSLSYSCWWSRTAFSHMICTSAMVRLCFMMMSYISCICGGAWHAQGQHGAAEKAGLPGISVRVSYVLLLFDLFLLVIGQLRHAHQAHRLPFGVSKPSQLLGCNTERKPSEVIERSSDLTDQIPSRDVPDRDGALGSGRSISWGMAMEGTGRLTLSSSDPHLLFLFRLTGTGSASWLGAEEWFKVGGVAWSEGAAAGALWAAAARYSCNLSL